MGLQQQIKQDLTAAMKARDEATKNALRVIMGEFSRQDSKDLDDDAVIGIIKKLVKSEKEVLARSGEASSDFLKVVEGYLPQMATEDQIRDWVIANVDFGQFKNKMQAMGTIMGHFGANADGRLVRSVLQQMET